MNSTLNWTSPANYKVNYPDPLPPAATATSADTGKNKVQYLLDKLQEESAEIIQAVSKVRRFGPQNHHPLRETTNIQELITELEDFLAIVAALEHHKYFDLTKHKTNILSKTTALISS